MAHPEVADQLVAAVEDGAEHLALVGVRHADLVDEADVEHATAKDLIAQIEDASPDEELYDAKVKVLGEYIDHHVKEEEGEMFPKVKKAKLDTKSLGEEMAVRKEELMAELTAEA